MPAAELTIPWAHVATVATTLGGYLLALLLIPRILLDRREAGATLAWILVIAFLPYVGAALFFLIGRTRVRFRTRKRVRAHARFQRSLQALGPQHACAATDEPPPLPAGARDIAGLTRAVTGTELLGGNQVELLVDTDTAYDRMEAAIRGAQHHVFMMSYIYRTDAAGRRFRDLLAERARAGVEVKLLVDGVGGHRVRGSFIRPFVEAGGRVAHFMPVLPLRPHWRPNLRNHRKILVVDNRIGFAGGLNIGEEYQGRRRRFAPWRDTHLRLEGPSAGRLQEIFADDWHFATGEDLVDAEHFPAAPACGGERVQVVDSGPDHDHETIHAVFFTAVNEADRRVYITTPYFVPDRAMLMALKTAAWRGVDVRLLLPGRSDMRLVQWAGRSYYQELVQAGVKIYEHRPGILHAKTMAVDGSWSTVGSANMDIRSFRLNFEVNVLVASEGFARQMEQVFLRDIERARPITLDGLVRKSRPVRFAEAFCRVLSPVL